MILSTSTSTPPKIPSPPIPREGWFSRWSRRCCTITGIYLALGLVLVLSPVLFVILSLIDLFSRSRSFGRLRFFAMLLVYLVSEAIALIAAFILWILSPILGKDRFISLNYTLQARWTQTLFDVGRRIYSLRVDAEGLEHGQNGPMIVFVRHVSVADTLLPAIFIANRWHIRLRYVLKRELLWDPCLDVVGQRISNAFVARDGAETERQIAMVQSLASNLGPREGVLIFPEGTRFSPDRLARIQEKDRARGLSRSEGFRHVLPPRLGGPLSLLKTAEGADVVVLSHTGFDKVRRFDDLIGGAFCGAVLSVRMTRISASQIPAGEEERANWLYQLWRDVDEFVELSRGKL